MVRVFGGTAFVIAGVAAVIEAHGHRPETFARGDNIYRVRETATKVPAHRGLSNDASDLLRIGAWALVIFGALLVGAGLIAYARRNASPNPRSR
jgi:hypothetical protein